MVAALERAGAAAVTIHGRSSEQRYTKSADWGLIERTAEGFSLPVIGNGDILTIYEASDGPPFSATWNFKWHGVTILLKPFGQMVPVTCLECFAKRSESRESSRPS